MRVLLFTKYADLGASSRVRCLQYLPELEKLGVKVDVDSLIDNEMLERQFISKNNKINFVFLWRFLRRIFLMRKLSSYDVIWVQKEFLPYIPFLFEKLILRSAKALVLDIDDAEYIKYQSGIKYFFLKKKYMKIAKYYDSIIVGNDYLKNQFDVWGGRTFIIPSVVDFIEYENSVIRDKPANVDFVIGWIGSPSTQKYISMILPAIEKFANSVNANVRLNLVGASKSMEMESPLIKVLSWSKATEVEMLCQFDIGVMPLKLTEWDRGKCSFKAIQCMAAGKPVVVSPTEANSKLVVNKVNGFLAQTPEEWLEAFNALYLSLEIREKMGERNREKIIKSYSIESQVNKVKEVFLQYEL